VIIRIIIAVMAIVLAGSNASGWYEYERPYREKIFLSRDGSDLDKATERGNGRVIIQDGKVRLECRGEPSLAAAIYKFRIPITPSYLEVKIYYRDLSQDDDIAVRLFIPTEDPASDEVVSGDTFLLRSDRTSDTIQLTPIRYLRNDTLELHLVAQNEDVAEIREIQLYSIEKIPLIRVIEKYYPDFWVSFYPRPACYLYHYYYYGRVYLVAEPGVYVLYRWPECYWTWRPLYFRTFLRVYTIAPRYVYYDCDPPDPPPRGAVEVRTKHPNPDPPSSQNYYSKKKELVLTFQMEDRKRNENLIYYSRKKNLDDEEQVSRIKPESNSKSSEVKTYHYSKGGFVQVLLSVGNSSSQNSSKTYYSRTRSFSQSAPSYVSRSESKEKEETRSYYSRARSVRGGR
jgi:hypothetical protein